MDEGTEEGYGSSRFGPGTLSGNELLPDFNKTVPLSLLQGTGKPFLSFANGSQVTRIDPILVAELSGGTCPHLPAVNKAEAELSLQTAVTYVGWCRVKNTSCLGKGSANTCFASCPPTR